MLIIGQGFSTVLKLVASGFLFRAYLKHMRKSALFWSAAFFVDAVSILFDTLERHYGLAISQALAVSLLFYGASMFLEEEDIDFSPPYVKDIAALAPLVLTVYVLVYYALRGEGEITSDELALVYGIAGFFYFFTGAMLIGIRDIYSKRGMYLATVFMLYGIHKMDYPFLRPVLWFAPIGFILGALFTLIEVALLLNIISSEKFKKLSSMPFKVEFKPHVVIVSPREYQELKKHLGGSPILAFLREILDVPKSWEAYFVSSVTAPRKISPTELEKIVELSHRYLMEAERIGAQGVILLNCLEYLRTYNEFRSIAKFLSSLKDYVTFYKGTIIIVLEESAWDGRELSMLKRILNVET